MVKKLEEFASSLAGKVWAQLALMVVPFLFGALLWFIVSWANDSKLNDHAQLIATSAINATLSALLARLEGEGRTQAAVDAAQYYRIEEAERDIAGLSADVRMLLLWRTNVLNRGEEPAL